MPKYEQQFGEKKGEQPQEEKSAGLRPLTLDDFEKSLDRERGERGSEKERLSQTIEEVLGGSRLAKITFKISARRKIDVLLDMVRRGEIKIKRDDEVILQTAFGTGRWDANRRRIKMEFTDKFNEKAKNDFIEEFGDFIGKIEIID